MTLERLPFGDLQESGFDPLSGASPVAMNVLLDEKGAMRRRPGISVVDDLPDSTDIDAVVGGTPVIGLHEAATGDLYGVFDTTRVFRATTAAALFELIGPGISVTDPGARPQFAETEMLLVLAQSGDMRKVTILGAPPQIDLLNDTSGGSPPAASHVVANSSRLLGNDRVIDRTKVRYSDVALGTTSYAGFEIWTPGSNTSGFFTAEARPDAVVALGENTNEVYVWGTESLQIYGADATLVFAPARAIETGCSAAYSVVKTDDEFYWLDHQRRFVRCTGQDAQPISKPIQSVLKSLSTVSDCFGYRVQVGQFDVLVWTFPTDGRTFVYQPGVGWGQWAGWNDATENWAAFTVTAHHQRISDSANLVGTSAGQVGKLDTAASTDLGTRINAYVETGFVDHGTGARKRCRCVRFVLRRGQTTGSTVPKGSLYYRDSLGSWEGPYEVSLGSSGDYETIVPFRNLGIYRTRQWKFQFDGSDELVLVRAEEEFDVLGD